MLRLQSPLPERYSTATDDELDEDRAAIAFRAVAAILGLPAASHRAAAS